MSGSLPLETRGRPDRADTRAAIGFLGQILLVGALAFALILPLYGPNSPFLKWGREGAQAWMLYRAAALAEDPELRAHPGGRVVWLVGSSIMRESFDASALNEALAERESPFRVKKFGQNRGASALAAGLAEQLPLAPGDLLVHNVALDNFRADWIDWAGIPQAQLSKLVPPGVLLSTTTASFPARLEQAAAVPWDFWRWHEEVLTGMSAWVEALWWLRAPRERTGAFHFSHRGILRASYMRPDRLEFEASRYHLTAADLDFGETQLHAWGVRRLEEIAAERGVELRLIHIPTSAWDQWIWQDPIARAAWETWLAERPNLSFAPILPDTAYYDRRHPNYVGREQLNAWLLDWVETGDTGRFERPPNQNLHPFPWGEGTLPAPGDAQEEEG